jgi:hypothetical protein
MLLVLSVVLLLGLWWPAPGPTTVDSDLTKLLTGLTGPWSLVWDVSYASLIVWPLIHFRLVTFYLPPLWGSVAMGWLRRHHYV